METKYIDLHTHTNYSDGIFLNPRALVFTAKMRGIDILAKTDHDTLAGYEEAKQEADKVGITLVPGVEISTPEYHLLALNFDPNNQRFREFISYSGGIQRAVCEARIEKTRQLGIPISLDKVRALFPESRLGKWNLFVTMLHDPECQEALRKYDKTSHELFRMFFGEEGLARLNFKPDVTNQEAIYETHLAGGVIGIAHGQKQISKVEQLEELIEWGIDFAEDQPNLRSMKFKIDFTELEKVALAHNLPISYGSDYHGPAYVRPMLGREKNVLSEGMAKLLKITPYN